MSTPAPADPAATSAFATEGNRRQLASHAATRAQVARDTLRESYAAATARGLDTVAAMREAVDATRNAERAMVRDCLEREAWLDIYASSLLLGSFLSRLDVRTEKQAQDVLRAMDWMATLPPEPADP